MEQIIQLSDLQPSPTNPRKHFQNAELLELAESIKTNGLQVPIIARQVGKKSATKTVEDSTRRADKYEVIDGERRYRACKEIGLKEVTVDLRTMNDQEVIEFQLMTFLHRKDITPIEEANAYMELSKKGVAPETIGARVAKPVSHIVRILRLLKLIPQAKKLFDSEVLPLGHALEICRLQPADQEDALKTVLPVGEDVPISLARFKSFIEKDYHLDLRKISFSKTDPKLVMEAGPCTHCVKRTGFNQGLFPDIQKADTCTDPACFKLKVEAHILQEKNRLKSEKVKVIEFTPEYTKPEDHPHAITTRSYHEVKGQPCKYAVQGIAVAGSDRGKLSLICNNKECSKHWGNDHRHSGAVEKKAEKKQSPAQAEKKRIEYLKKKIAQEKEHKLLEALVEVIPNHVPSVYDKKLWVRVVQSFMNNWQCGSFVRGHLKLKKNVNFEKLPPKIIMITSGGKTVLNSETVNALDYAEIQNVDLIIRPYNWTSQPGTKNEKTGVKAYLKSLYITIVEDEFESKYRDVPMERVAEDIDGD